MFFRWQQQHFKFQPAGVAVEERSSVVQNTHARLQISLLTRLLSLLPVSVHLAMACDGCSFDSFSIVLLSLKRQQNMKIMFSCIHFPIGPYPPPPNNEKTVFYSGKLRGLTGMRNIGSRRAGYFGHPNRFLFMMPLDTDCMVQNGSTCGRVFTTFKPSFFIFF